MNELAKPLTFGLSIFVGVGLKLREKRKALEEQRKQLQELAEAKIGPGASDYIWMLAGDFRKSLDDILELLALIDDCMKRLQVGLTTAHGN